jgi:acyl-CoA synthetase (AMP-forming)/AMP-acid ligase II
LAVIGMPDARLGEVGLAVVVPADETAPDVVERQLIEWASERLANFKVPRAVRVVDELPTNASGKVLKRELREQFGETAGAGAGPRR